MPYIEPRLRDALLSRLDPICLAVREGNVGDGELNYILTRIVKAWIGATPSYKTYNAALGVLEACKLEFYRRQVAEYEDKKCEENGDVYE